MGIKYICDKCGALSDEPLNKFHSGTRTCDLCSKCVEGLNKIVFDYLKDTLHQQDRQKKGE